MSCHRSIIFVMVWSSIFKIVDMSDNDDDDDKQVMTTRTNNNKNKNNHNNDNAQTIHRKTSSALG